MYIDLYNVSICKHLSNNNNDNNNKKKKKKRKFINKKWQLTCELKNNKHS